MQQRISVACIREFHIVNAFVCMYCVYIKYIKVFVVYLKRCGALSNGKLKLA